MLTASFLLLLVPLTVASLYVLDPNITEVKAEQRYHQDMILLIETSKQMKSKGEKCLGDNTCCSKSSKCGWGEGDCDSNDDCFGNLVCSNDQYPNACQADIPRELYQFHVDSMILLEDRKFSGTDDCCTMSKEMSDSLNAFKTYKVGNEKVNMNYEKEYHEAMEQVINYYLWDQENRSDCMGGNDCCHNKNQCTMGEGDCDKDSECFGRLVCAKRSCKEELGDDLAHVAKYHIGIKDYFSESDDCCALPEDMKNILRNFVTVPVA